MTGARESEGISVGAAPVARRWSFASVVLDERSLEMMVGGQPMEIEPKPLEVLLHLLRHSGEVVTKDELLEAVWPGRILSDSVIATCVKKLREALHDEAQAIIKTVHGYGYRLAAPVKVEDSAALPPPRFDIKPGDSPPLRPLWRLEKRLGAGGHGEAWLAQHEKTRERRAFKFAAGPAALAALKREITLYRLLHDALGDKAPALDVLDWNLTEPPCFLEMGYAEAGSLAEWAQAQGGIHAVPMTLRIDLAAQVAEALAAAHSMGVLHKDLKPSNVLIVSGRDAPPRVKLSDFGSGGLLDPARLDALGITRLGFTQTGAQTTGGTPMYCAPETLAGQPPTIQADIYALGVMLYQLVTGDFQRALAPGWERDIDDELLREDIALAAEGHAPRRLADAALLAQRLRTLESRRAQRAVEQTTREAALRAQRAAEAEAQRARLALERLRGRRLWMRATMAALAVGMVASLALSIVATRARDQAAAAAATSKAVSDFVSQDMFAQISSGKPLRSLTVKEVLDAAATQVPVRFADTPVAAAQVHASLGASYLALDDVAAAEQELDQALALAEQHEGLGSETALEVVTQLLVIKAVLGKLPAELPRYQAVLAAGTRQLGQPHPKLLRLRRQLAQVYFEQGESQAALAELRQLVVDAGQSQPPDEDFVAEAEAALGLTLWRLAEFAEAETVLRNSVARLQRLLGGKHVRVATARMHLARVLTVRERYAEAETELADALAAASAWAPSTAAANVLGIRTRQGQLWMEQGRLAQAAALENVRDTYASWQGAELDQSFAARHPLAEVYLRQGRLPEAETELRLALKGAEKFLGDANADVQRIRIDLADLLRRRGRTGQAWEEIRRVNAPALAKLPPRHPHWAEWRRVEGLLWLGENDPAQARAALTEALRIVEFRYGASHWRTQRARQELAGLPQERA